MTIIRKFIHKSIWFFTVVNGILLLLANLSLYINPKSFVVFQFLGLAFPIIFLINFLFVFYWIFTRQMKLLFPLMLLVFHLFHASKYLQLSSTKKPLANPDFILHVATFNSQLFGKYQNKNYVQTFKSEMQKKNLDLVCIQEFNVAGKNVTLFLDSIKNACNTKYFQFVPIVEKSHYGLAIFSKYNIIQIHRLNFGSNGNMGAYIDVLVNNDTVRVFNVHLQSIRFKKMDYEFIESIENEGEKDHLEKSKNIIKRMQTAYINRANQAEIVGETIKNSNYPILICGDFNDVPMSYAYHTIFKNNLNDAFRETGNGLETTYTGPFPSFRIDYIGSSYHFKTVQYSSSSIIPSDHKLVEAAFQYFGKKIKE